MPTDAEQLATIKSQTLALIVELTADHKPTYTLDGQEVEWTEYLDSLWAKIDKINGLLAAETITEIQSQGWS